MNSTIPKAGRVFQGDINAAVIYVQLKTGVRVDKGWWAKNVGDYGTAEEILERFDRAYARDFTHKIEERDRGY